MTTYFHVTSPRAVSDWSFEPLQTLGLLVLGGLYVAGVLRARRGGSAIGWLRPSVFALGFGLLVLALLPPMHHAGEERLSLHMAQHTILILAPLLLVAGRAGTRTLQALPSRLRGEVARRVNRLMWLTSRPVALLVLMGTVISWHIPMIFEPAARSPVLHALEHVTLAVAATLYWVSIVGVGARRRSGYGASLGSILILMLVGGVFGGLLTFSRVPWYPEYAERAAAIEVDWLTDQQLAGVWMWVPMGLVLMGVGAWLAYMWATGTIQPQDRFRSQPTRESV